LDLQVLFIEMGKQIALAQGWYHRCIVQFLFVAIFAVIFTAAFLLFTRTYRDLFRQYAPTFWGLLFLLGCVIIGAATFNHFGEAIQYDFQRLAMVWVLELAGVYMIFLTLLKELIVPSIQGRDEPLKKS
jgi:hypothetical protein